MTKDNDGLALLNGSAAGIPRKTVIVLGAPRGGTSMVAGTLSKLGVFMGRPEGLAPFYENAELGECSKAGDRAAAAAVIARFDREHAAWGIKVLPKSWRFWRRKAIFHEPVYVVVLRDALAIAKRRLVSKDKDLLKSMKASASGAGFDASDLALDRTLLKELFKAWFLNLRLLAFLWFNKRPALLVSYEKALTRPEDFVNGVARFIGLADEAKLQEAVAFVQPSPKQYLMRSSTYSQLDPAGEHFGYLDIIEPSRLCGWALSVSRAAPLPLELWVNGRRAGELLADIPRADVQQADPRFHEHCGFLLENGKEQTLSWDSGDRLELRVAGTEIQLVNSPCVAP